MSDKNISVWVFTGALLIALVTGASVPVTEFILEKKEEKRIYLLNQVQAYGAIYFMSVGGTQKEFLETLNEQIVYIEPEEINLFSQVVEPFLFSSLLSEKELSYVQTRKVAPELSEKLLNKYTQKLEQYRKRYVEND